MSFLSQFPSCFSLEPLFLNLKTNTIKLQRLQKLQRLTNAINEGREIRKCLHCPVFSESRLVFNALSTFIQNF